MNSERYLSFYLGCVVGVMATVVFTIILSPKEKESRTLLRMTLEDGRRIHLPLAPQDEAFIDKNGGEIKIKSLEFRKKE